MAHIFTSITKPSRTIKLCVFTLATLILGSCADQTGPHEEFQHKNALKDALQSQFANPPDDTKPLTWYHSMNSNMSKHGVTKDFEAMADAGIGGVLFFSLGRSIPKGEVLFNSPEQMEIIGHMASEAKRLGLSFGIHNTDGWSSSGGPWISPEHGMKQVTWNETIVNSNADNAGVIDIQLAQPMTMLDYYRDIAALAYPSLETERIDATFSPTISASDPDFDTRVVLDVDVTEKSSITSKGGEPVWLQFTYQQPVTIRFASMDINFGKHIKYELHYSDDGTNFKKHVDLRVNRPGRVRWALDGAFEGITAKYFRIVADKTLNIFEARLASTPKMTNYLGRTLASRTDFNQLPAIGNPEKAHIIDPASIINLSDKLSVDGQLNATLPPGQWTIMRFGYTAKGTTNIPPTAEGRGLEVDKFSRASFDVHYDAYVTNVINKVKDVAPDAMQYLIIDSYEVGGQNWTNGYEQMFKEKYAYDLIPYLPLFAGKFVESPASTEAVAWDIRNLSNQLITENYYQYFTELAHQDGMRSYIEPYGIGPFNDLDAGSKADIPMGEFWLKRNIYMLASATSAGHIYNRNVIAAESFTATKDHNWKFHPAYAKFDGDKTWALGVNQFVFHRFIHQANTNVLPGMTMDYWGAHIDATQPWFASAGKDWFTYISRGQYLLRHGQPVSDVLWYLGDSAPSVCPDRRHNGKFIPTYVNYDCLNHEKLQELFYEDERYRLNHGMKYKILYLDNAHPLYFESLEKIYQFAKQGGVIIGDPIKGLAGRNHSLEQQAEFKRMVDFIWSQGTTHAKPKTDQAWQSLYKQHALNFDLRVKDIDEVFYTHRHSTTHDIYFVYNDTGKHQLFDATFEVTGKVPELWDARTGLTRKLAAFSENAEQTELAFRLAPNESVFVVFADDATGKVKLSPQVVRDHLVEAVYDQDYSIQLLGTQKQQISLALDGETRSVAFNNIPDKQVLNGSWQVSFEKEYGLDQSFTFESLSNWKDSSNPDIRAYSGIATYEKSFVLSAELLQPDQDIFLDLGEVANSAQVFLNGKEVGVAWIAPYRVELTQYLEKGDNKLTIKVANSWMNRLITDEQYPDTSDIWQENGQPVRHMPQWYTQNKPLPFSGEKGHRRTFTTNKFVNKDDPLLDSGLLGPVSLEVRKTIKL